MKQIIQPSFEEMYGYLKSTTKSPMDWYSHSFHESVTLEEVQDIYTNNVFELIYEKNCIHISTCSNLKKFEQQPYSHHGGFSYDLGIHVTPFNKQGIDVEDTVNVIKKHHGVDKLYIYQCEILGEIKPIILPEFAAHPSFRFSERQVSHDYYIDMGWTLDATIIKIIEYLIIKEIYKGAKISEEIRTYFSNYLIELRSYDYTDVANPIEKSKEDLLKLEYVLNLVGANQIAYINAIEGNFEASRIIFNSEQLKIEKLLEIV